MKYFIAILVALLAMAGISAATPSTLGTNAITSVMTDSGFYTKAEILSGNTGYNVVVISDGDDMMTFAKTCGAVAAAMVVDGYDSDGMSVIGIISQDGKDHAVMLTEDKAKEMFDLSNAGKTNAVGTMAYQLWGTAMVL